MSLEVGAEFGGRDSRSSWDPAGRRAPWREELGQGNRDLRDQEEERVTEGE